jgi:formylglycine-generating enzyme required for sulfatase activity
VTVEHYKARVKEGGCFIPNIASVKSNHYCTCWLGNRLALNCVTWDQANDFCEWVEGRLPSEAEWEFAATSGGRSIKYPWGNDADFSCNKAVLAFGRESNSGLNHPDRRACGDNAVASPCSKSGGNPAQGICDLSGNLWEWVGNCDSEYNQSCYGKKVNRGGGFWSNAYQVRSTRRALSKDVAQMDVGFRCVR